VGLDHRVGHRIFFGLVSCPWRETERRRRYLNSL